MSDDTRPDPTPPLAPEEVVLDDDLTSEMIRLRPLAADAVAAADATDLAEAEGSLELDNEAVLAERDSYKDIALRLQAYFDNYRRGVSVQLADEVQRATG